MTTTTIRPDGTSVDHANWVRTGGATKHGVLADDSDATYLTNDSSPGGGVPASITLSLGTFTLGTGRVKSVLVRVRGEYNGSSQPLVVRLLNLIGDTVLAESIAFTSTSSATLSTSSALFAAAIAGGSTDQEAIDGLSVRLEGYAAGGGATTDVEEVYVDLTYAAIPTATITYPTGSPTITTSTQPTATWTHTPGSDGAPQSWYEVKVYTAAQYGAGGFDPDTSTPAWTSGVVAGSATSQVLGPLDNSTTYRVYVRTAQTVNYEPHWSAWDFEGFDIDVATSDVDDVTATADDANARILVAVDRDAATEAWDTIEVQRSVDAGTTWEYVRGAQHVDATGDANNFDIYDYEVDNGADVLYRARARYEEPGGELITGAWVQSSPAVSWDSLDIWLKDVGDPTKNTAVDAYVDKPVFVRPQRRGVFEVLGRQTPVTVADSVRGKRRCAELMFEVESAAEYATLVALVESTDVLLVQWPAEFDINQMYASVGDVDEMFDSPISSNVVRQVALRDVVEVDAPADEDAGT